MQPGITGQCLARTPSTQSTAAVIKPCLHSQLSPPCHSTSAAATAQPLQLLHRDGSFICSAWQQTTDNALKVPNPTACLQERQQPGSVCACLHFSPLVLAMEAVTDSCGSTCHAA